MDEWSTPGDAEIRSVLKQYLEEQWAASPETRLIEELGLCRGKVRIDLAVVNGHLHGYEIKSDRDRLDRLPSQAEVYSEVVDYATIVVGPRYIADVLQIVPSWWGVLRVVSRGVRVSVEPIRPPRENTERIPRSLAELLWRDEALALLQSREAAHGVRTKPRAVVWDRVCEAFDVSEIAAVVRDRLRIRAESSAPA